MRIEDRIIPSQFGALHAVPPLESAGRLPSTPGTGKRPVEKTAPCRPACDARQCRIWLNEAQREIDRLRRSTAMQPGLAADLQHALDAARRFDAHEPHDPARQHAVPTPKAARIYAITPIGKLDLPNRPTPPHPDIVSRVQVVQVTNLGTLVDALI